MNYTQNIREFILIITSILLSACGGSGSNSTPTSVTASTGIFIDSPVINIGYRTETLQGVTNSFGEYDYLPGETVTFFIGDLAFPPTLASGLVTPLDLANADDTSDFKVINMIRLLQTLDQDGNPVNGITITDMAKANATQVDFGLSILEFESSSAVTNLVMNAGQNNVPTELISTTSALALFEQELSANNITFDSTTPQNETSTMATRYFPLAIGNIWQYAITIIEDGEAPYNEFSYRNSNKLFTFNNSASYNIKNDISTPDAENENFVYSKWDDGIYYQGGSDSDADDQGFSIALKYSPPVLYLKSTFNINDTWSTTSDVFVEIDGNVVDIHSVMHNSMVLAIEDVTVPAGTFENCYKISIEISSTTDTDFNESTTIWLAENVGVVKSVSMFTDSNHTSELQYSNIGGEVNGQEVIN